MSKIRLHGSSSGYTEIAPVAASGNNTLTLPDDGTILSKDAAGAVGVTSVHTTNITATGIATITTAKIGAGVTISESGIEASGIGITCANINGTQIGGRRNIVINGAMNVTQRGTSSTSLGASAGYFTLDRYRTTFSSTAGRLTMAQVADVHDGFANAMKFTCTTADTSVGAGEYFILQQKFEGQDLQQLQKGSSDAKEFTVSFYVKGNASATYVVEMYDLDNDRQISKTFSVTTSWTRVVLTFPADTTGALDDDNAASLQLGIWLHGGSNYTSGTLSTTWSSVTQANRAVGTSSFFDSTNRTFFLTGVQLEVGPQATPFEHRSFGEELSLCQRYYAKTYSGDNAGYFGVPMASSGNSYGNATFPVTMRTTPTIVLVDGTGATGKATQHGNNYLTATAGGIQKNGFTTVSRPSGDWASNAQNPVQAGYTADAEL